MPSGFKQQIGHTSQRNIETKMFSLSYTFTKETRTQYQLQETNVAYSFLLVAIVVDGEKDDEEHVGWFFEVLKNYQS
jgi:hypothetical protein